MHAILLRFNTNKKDSPSAALQFSVYSLRPWHSSYSQRPFGLPGFVLIRVNSWLNPLASLRPSSGQALAVRSLFAPRSSLFPANCHCQLLLPLLLLLRLGQRLQPVGGVGGEQLVDAFGSQVDLVPAPLPDVAALPVGGGPAHHHVGLQGAAQVVNL